ncbi:MAG: pseudouridine synthase [Chloroflexi bacterium]|nr:pseudouridine synthase [Chloroflexota bacterium]
MPEERNSPPATDQLTLVKYLVSAGLGSRRTCASLIMNKFVTVNETIAESLMMPVGQDDRIQVEGRSVEARRAGHVYLLLNKPDGYLSTISDDRGRRTIMDLVPRALRLAGLVPAGRLDLHSTGLVLLTDDGELVNRVTHPRYEVDKEYHIKLDGVLNPTSSARLRSGVEIESGLAKAKAVRRMTEEPGFRYSITLNEGKKREVRLMLRAVGRQVTELRRVRVGTLTLGDMTDGQIRELTDMELSEIRRQVGLAPDATRRPKRTPGNQPVRKPPAPVYRRGGRSGGSNRGSRRARP